MDRVFVDALASSASAPGGGAACAYAGVFATCLASMVANLTVGREKYAAVESDMTARLDDLAGLRARLEELVDDDEAAFSAVSQAYGMPRATDEEKAARTDAIQQALYFACEVPLEVVQISAQVAEIARFMALSGNKNVLADAGACASLARAAGQGASLMVLVNVRSMRDADRAAAYETDMTQALDALNALADEVEAYATDHVGRK